jgi:hypothetical protein
MALNNILESLDFLQVLSESKPVFLNNLVAKVVNEVLDEVYHSLIKKIGWCEKLK